jgi:hypothetical protein
VELLWLGARGEAAVVFSFVFLKKITMNVIMI